MLPGIQGLKTSLKYGSATCPPPSKKCRKDPKCLKCYYKKCPKQWIPGSVVFGAIGS